jgi:hypothetical protein
MKALDPLIFLVLSILVLAVIVALSLVMIKALKKKYPANFGNAPQTPTALLQGLPPSAQGKLLLIPFMVVVLLIYFVSKLFLAQ